MYLSTMIETLRVELQDTASSLYTDDELVRAIEKSVSLLSRFIPKRSIAETTFVQVVTGETLTIASNTGTLAVKPVKKGTLAIVGKTLDTDYQVNYLTGVVTELGSGLPDGSYTASYEADPNLINLSSVLAPSSYIKLERIEYPVGNYPPSLITFDSFGDYILVRGTGLADKEHLRVIYQWRWTPPAVDEEGDYPVHLDDAIIIGSAGQALIFKAEAYLQDAVVTIDDVVTLLETLDGITLVDPALTPPTPPTFDALTPPDDYSYSKPSVPSLPTPPTKPTAPSLADLTAPANITFTKPTKPSLPSAPTAPSAPNLLFTDFDAALANAETAFSDASASLGSADTALTSADSALDKVAAEVVAGKAHLTSGVSQINAATRGDAVGKTFGEYCDHQLGVAKGYYEEALSWGDLVAKHIAQGSQYNDIGSKYIAEALAEIEKIKANLSKYQLQLSSYDADVRAYAATITAMEDAFGGEIQAENAAINNFSAQIGKYQQQISAELLKVSKYSEELRAFASEVAVYGTDCSFKISNYQGELQAENIGVSNFNAKITKYRAQIDEQMLDLSKYSEQVKAFTAQVQEYNTDADAFETKVTAVINRATQLAVQITNYLNISGRYLASGQAKINEFLASLGIKPEFPTQKASSEQRA